MNFIEEVKWRGMLHDSMPGLSEQLDKEMTTAYVGIDPTADSLHIGHLVSIMLLKHLQISGHKPLALVGGATGMIGDPSGKAKERNLLNEETLRHNENCIKNQLAKFLDFNTSEKNAAQLVNNYDWMKNFSFLEFIRDIGKHITVNYMMAKDSVKTRLDKENTDGMSFTEFTYQLVQGYDFLHLYQNMNCKLQMGGSDQWGNITTGTELIGKIASGKAWALTCPLITKADGGKFGKTEEGNVWLDANRTSPYKFYQFWINCSDEDAERYIKIFTLLNQETINDLVASHLQAPHLRILQTKLAEEVTILVHSQELMNSAKEASAILFGNGTAEQLANIDLETFKIFEENVPFFQISKQDMGNGKLIGELLVEKAKFFPSKSDLRRTIESGSLYINHQKITQIDYQISENNLLYNKYLLVKKGKKSFYLISVN